MCTKGNKKVKNQNNNVDNGEKKGIAHHVYTYYLLQSIILL